MTILIQGMNAVPDKKGLTLVEVLIAMVVLLLVFLALMQTALVSIDSNMKNLLRDEAVGIAEGRMRDARNTPYTSLVSDTGSLAGADCPAGFSATGTLVERNFRNVAGLDYCINAICQDIGPGGDNNCATDDTDTKQVTVTVGWNWKGEGYTHVITSILRRQ